MLEWTTIQLAMKWTTIQLAMKWTTIQLAMKWTTIQVAMKWTAIQVAEQNSLTLGVGNIATALRPQQPQLQLVKRQFAAALHCSVMPCTAMKFS